MVTHVQKGYVLSRKYQFWCSRKEDIPKEGYTYIIYKEVQDNTELHRYIGYIQLVKPHRVKLLDRLHPAVYFRQVVLSKEDVIDMIKMNGRYHEEGVKLISRQVKDEGNTRLALAGRLDDIKKETFMENYDRYCWLYSLYSERSEEDEDGNLFQEND